MIRKAFIAISTAAVLGLGLSSAASARTNINIDVGLGLGGGGIYLGGGGIYLGGGYPVYPAYPVYQDRHYGGCGWQIVKWKKVWNPSHSHKVWKYRKVWVCG